MALGSIRRLVIILAFSLQGCMPAFLMKNSVEFNLYDNMKGAKAVYKNTWPSCGGYPAPEPGDKYITIVDDCKVKPEGYVPKEIVIEYAPWLTYEQRQQIPELKAKEIYIMGDGISDSGKVVKNSRVLDTDEGAIKYNKTILKNNEIISIDKLGANAWKKIVLHPQELVDQYKNIRPNGRGAFTQGKVIEYNIRINADGTYNVTHRLLWKRPISTLVHD